MPKWLTPLILTLAIGCARTNAKAQPADAPPAQPAQPTQPQAEAAQSSEEATLQTRERVRAQADAERAAAAMARAQAQEARAARVAVRSQVKKEKAAWLGVSTDRVPGALRQQLKLKHKGIGLIVEHVEPKSPAADAGLQQYDIIEKLDDQWLVNSEQFGVLIRMHAAGDQISLTIIREGQPQTVTAKLGEKEMPVVGMGQFNFQFPEPAAWNQAPDVFGAPVAEPVVAQWRTDDGVPQVINLSPVIGGRRTD
jgi:C-terminal processing protease CtpA/Prc